MKNICQSVDFYPYLILIGLCLLAPITSTFGSTREKAFIPGVVGHIIPPEITEKSSRISYRLLKAPDNMSINEKSGSLVWVAPLDFPDTHVEITIEVEERIPNKKLRLWEFKYRNVTTIVKVAAMEPLELLPTNQDNLYELYPLNANFLKIQTTTLNANVIKIQTTTLPSKWVFLSDEPDNIYTVNDGVTPITNIFYSRDYEYNNFAVNFLLSMAALEEKIGVDRKVSLFYSPKSLSLIHI